MLKKSAFYLDKQKSVIPKEFSLFFQKEQNKMFDFHFTEMFDSVGPDNFIFYRNVLCLHFFPLKAGKEKTLIMRSLCQE